LQVEETFDCDPTFEAICSSSEPHLLIQGDLNNLVSDLNFLKKEAEILASRLKEWNLLQQGTKVCFFFATARMNLNVFSPKKMIQHFVMIFALLWRPLDISTIHQRGACSLTPQKLA
jgi:hypothetical protein